jgi:hypothetical protein
MKSSLIRKQLFVRNCIKDLRSFCIRQINETTPLYIPESCHLHNRRHMNITYHETVTDMCSETLNESQGNVIGWCLHVTRFELRQK